MQRAYEDVIQLFGKSGRYPDADDVRRRPRRLFEQEPALKNDPRFKLYPEWMQQQVGADGQPRGAEPGRRSAPATARW